MSSIQVSGSQTPPFHYTQWLSVWLDQPRRPLPPPPPTTPPLPPEPSIGLSTPLSAPEPCPTPNIPPPRKLHFLLHSCVSYKIIKRNSYVLEGGGARACDRRGDGWVRLNGLTRSEPGRRAGEASLACPDDFHSTITQLPGEPPSSLPPFSSSPPIFYSPKTPGLTLLD